MLYQSDYRVVLTFNAISDGQLLTATFCFKRCLATRFGFPNDEARWSVPRFRGISYGIYEVKGSAWLAEKVGENQHSFPDTTAEMFGRHLVFAFHDSTFECLTQDYEYELSAAPYRDIFAKIIEPFLNE